jgi:hypothetical protein
VDAAEQALVAAALARRDDVPDDRHRDNDQAAAAEPLHRAEDDQLQHAPGEPAQRGADEEEHERGLQDALAPVHVAELPVDRSHHRRCQQVRGHHPREVLEAAQLADDCRQRRRDDRLVERRDEEHEQQRAEDEAPPSRGHLSQRPRLPGLRGRAPGGRTPAAR